MAESAASVFTDILNRINKLDIGILNFVKHHLSNTVTLADEICSVFAALIFKSKRSFLGGILSHGCIIDDHINFIPVTAVDGSGGIRNS